MRIISCTCTYTYYYTKILYGDTTRRYYTEKVREVTAPADRTHVFFLLVIPSDYHQPDGPGLLYHHHLAIKVGSPCRPGGDSEAEKEEEREGFARMQAASEP